MGNHGKKIEWKLGKNLFECVGFHVFYHPSNYE